MNSAVSSVASSASRIPCLFLGHGTPMNVLSDNRYTQAWGRLGETLPRPKAILAISAHWCTHGTGVTAMDRPPTIHDFGAFPQALFDVQYPCPGDPALARRVAEVLAPVEVVQDHGWGLDHGTWSVLSKVYPKADIPVIQLSIDMAQPLSYHLELGRKLAPLRDEGVLILGSGNVVHNLRVHRRGEDMAYDWAVRFNDRVRAALLAGDLEPLVDQERWNEDARLSVPTLDHYLPLLYVVGAGQGDAAQVEIDGVYSGSMSMLSVSYGRAGG